MAIINGVGRVGIRNYVAPTSTSTNPLWNSLVAYYTGDNTPNDAKGTNNATLVNGATYATGKINGGFSLDGINDYVSIPNGTFNPTSGSYTISTWISSAPVASFGVKTIFGLGGFITNSIVVYLYNDESSTKIRFLNSNSGTYQLIESTLPSFGSLHHILCVKDTASNKYYLYVNGSLVAQSTISINYVANNLGTNIGSFGNGFNGYSPFAGIIDEVGLWNRAITAAEVTELYNAGSGKQYIATTPTYTARTTAFAAATGITDTTILNALNTFDTGLISNGLDTKMKALYPFVGGTATTHKFNFMDARDLNAAFRIQFNGGWVHSSTGAKGNGTNTYMNTFFNQFNNFTDWKKSTLGIYSRTNESGLFLEGNYGFNDSNFALYTRLADGRFLFQAGAPFATAVTSDSLGFLVGSSISGSDRRVYKNGVKLATNTETNTFGVLTGLNTYFGALNGSGTATYISNKDYALAFLGESMTDTDQTTLYTLTQALQTSLSRAV